MSNILLPLALNHEGNLSGSEKLVLIYLCNLSNEAKGNYAWPSYQYISKKSGFSLATVKRACKSLKKKGFITWINGKYIDDEYSTNHYRINLSLLKATTKCNLVSKRATEQCHTDTFESITVSSNNLINNLPNNLNITQKPRYNLD